MKMENNKRSYHMTEKQNHTERDHKVDSKKMEKSLCLISSLMRVYIIQTIREVKDVCKCVRLCRVCVCSGTAPGFKLFIQIITIHSVLNPITCFSASHHWHMHNSWILTEQMLLSTYGRELLFKNHKFTCQLSIQLWKKNPKTISKSHALYFYLL